MWISSQLIRLVLPRNHRRIGKFRGYQGILPSFLFILNFLAQQWDIRTDTNTEGKYKIHDPFPSKD